MKKKSSELFFNPLSGYTEEAAIRLDTIFQDEMIELLANLQETTWIVFKDSKFIAKILADSVEDNASFLQNQATLVYGEGTTHTLHLNNPLELNTLRNYLIEHGFNIKNVCYSNDTGDVYIEIDPHQRKTIQVRQSLSSTGLPSTTDSFYQGDKTSTNSGKQNALPRVLNIGSGGDANRQLPHAINLDASSVGRPDIVADAKALPFKTGAFTAVIASHILEHIPANEIPNVLEEWIRVIHPKGLLRIAVPDANLTLKELLAGTTTKGENSYSIPGGSAPLTQLIGLGGEYSKTDSRWRHQILFTYKLLVDFLSKSGFDNANEYDKNEALSFLCGIKLDEVNRYSLRVEATRPKQAHPVHKEITPQQYEKLKTEFQQSNVEIFQKHVSIVVPVRNEAENLPLFLIRLQSALQELQVLGVQTEVVFAINNTTDNSAEIIQDYASGNQNSKFKIIHSQPGILPAFVEGVTAREFSGAIIKLDIDSYFDKHALALMFINMSQNPQLEVTYADAKPYEDVPNGLNALEYYQDFREERLYFHGRMSLYRENPFNIFPAEEILASGVAVEDMILSSLYIYYRGIDSIGVTKGLYTKTKKTASFDTLKRNWERARREMKRIEAAFPHLKILRSILKREMMPLETMKDDNPQKALFRQYAHYFQKSMQVLAKINFPESEAEKLTTNNWDSVR